MRNGLLRLGLLSACCLFMVTVVEAGPKAKAKSKADEKEQASIEAAVKAIQSLGGTVEHIDLDPDQPIGAVILSGKALTPTLVRRLTAFPEMHTLILRDGPIDNSILPELAALENLQALDLENTLVSDAGLPAFQHLPKIREIYLTGSAVTAKGVEALRKLIPTTQVYWLPPLPQLDSATAYFKLGEELNNQNERVQAIRAYTAAMQLDPKLSAAYLARGWTLMKEDEHALAKADFETFVKLQPKSALGLGGLALADYLTGDLEQALENAEKSLKLDKDCADALYVRGMVRFDSEEYQQALPDFEKAVGLEPKDAANHERLGWTYFELKMYEAAFTSFDVAVRLDPQFEHAYYGRGLYWMSQGQPAKAIEDFTRAFQIDPTFPDYAVDLALAYATKGDWQSAVATQRKVVAIASEDDQSEQQRRLKLYLAKQLPRMPMEVESAAKPGLEKK